MKIKDIYKAGAREKLDFQLFVYSKRKELKMSQKELAEKAETSQKIISRIENGFYNPSLELAGRLKFVIKKAQKTSYKK